MAFLGTNFTANLLKIFNNPILDFQFQDQTANLELAPASDARIFHGYISLAQVGRFFYYTNYLAFFCNKPFYTLFSIISKILQIRSF